MKLKIDILQGIMLTRKNLSIGVIKSKRLTIQPFGHIDNKYNIIHRRAKILIYRNVVFRNCAYY